jgi:hypothetical protein
VDIHSLIVDDVVIFMQRTLSGLNDPTRIDNTGLSGTCRWVGGYGKRNDVFCGLSFDMKSN